MRLIWNEKLGLPDRPYMIRWGIEFGKFSIRLHRWLGSDDERAFHDHAWWFFTLVLWGGYIDVTPISPVGPQPAGKPEHRDYLGMGSMRFRPADHKHTVRLRKPNTWTLVVTGPVVRRWAFYVNGKKYMRDKYFAVFGHHDREGGEPVRLRPDGSRIS